ncbi:hypothetical protein TNCV_2624181 [Trichonephila clavipes]|nr:hypothetical protein TNCV_2624181 [Trichonephila clavipes]
MVGHGLEVSPQPKVAWIQVGDLGGQAVGKFRLMILFTEMAAEHLFHTTVDVFRSPFLLKHRGFTTSSYLKSRNNGLL